MSDAGYGSDTGSLGAIRSEADTRVHQAAGVGGTVSSHMIELIVSTTS
jgi:hypothetical protein